MNSAHNIGQNSPRTDFSQPINLAGAISKAKNYGLVLQNFIDGTRGFAEALANDIVPSLEWLAEMKSLFGINPSSGNHERADSVTALHNAPNNNGATEKKYELVDFEVFFPEVLKDSDLSNTTIAEALDIVYAKLDEINPNQKRNITVFKNFLREKLPGILKANFPGIAPNQERIEREISELENEPRNRSLLGIARKLFNSLKICSQNLPTESN